MIKNVSLLLSTLSITPQYFPTKEQSTICKIMKVAGFLLALPFLLLADLLYRAQEGFGNLYSARQSKIDPNERWPCTPCKASEEDRFGAAAASTNSQNLTERGISAPFYRTSKTISQEPRIPSPPNEVPPEPLELPPPPLQEIIAIEMTPTLVAQELTPSPLEPAQINPPPPCEEAPSPELTPMFDPIVSSPQEPSSLLTHIGIVAFGVLGLGAMYLLSRYGQEDPSTLSLGQCPSNHSNLNFNSPASRALGTPALFPLLDDVEQFFSSNQALGDRTPILNISNTLTPQADTPHESPLLLLLTADPEPAPQTPLNLDALLTGNCNRNYIVPNNLPLHTDTPQERTFPLLLAADPEPALQTPFSFATLLENYNRTSIVPSNLPLHTDTPQERTFPLLLTADPEPAPQTPFSFATLLENYNHTSIVPSNLPLHADTPQESTLPLLLTADPEPTLQMPFNLDALLTGNCNRNYIVPNNLPLHADTPQESTLPLLLTADPEPTPQTPFSLDELLNYNFTPVAPNGLSVHTAIPNENFSLLLSAPTPLPACPLTTPQTPFNLVLDKPQNLCALTIVSDLAESVLPLTADTESSLISPLIGKITAQLQASMEESLSSFSPAPVTLAAKTALLTCAYQVYLNGYPNTPHEMTIPIHLGLGLGVINVIRTGLFSTESTATLLSTIVKASAAVLPFFL